MAVTINVSVNAGVTVNEQYDATSSPGTGQVTLSFNEFNQNETLNSSSTPPATKFIAEKYTGTQNLDFTALARTALGDTVDASGLKLQLLLLVNLSTTDDVTISDAAANPYSINGTDDVVVPVGGYLLMQFNDQLDDVAAGALGMDITPGAGESFQLVLVFG